MIARLRDLWHSHRWLLLGFAAALALTLFFGARLLFFAIYWNDPAHRNQPIEGWMPLGYISQSWGLSPAEIDAALGIPREAGRGRVSLAQIATDKGVPVDDLIDALDRLIARRDGPRDP